MNTNLKNQLVINKIQSSNLMNVIYNGVLLFATANPDIQDIMDAFGMNKNDTFVLVGGVPNDSYINTVEIPSVTFEKPQVDTDQDIPNIDFESNSDNLLRAAGVDPAYAKASTQLPKVGDSIYIPAQHNSLNVINGGKAVVNEIIQRANVDYIMVEGLPGMIFRWDVINEYQRELAAEFGETAASMSARF